MLNLLLCCHEVRLLHTAFCNFHLLPSSGDCLVVITLTNSMELDPLFLLHFMLQNSTVIFTSPNNSCWNVNRFQTLLKINCLYNDNQQSDDTTRFSYQNTASNTTSNKLISKHVYQFRWDNRPHHLRRDSPVCHHTTAHCRYTQFHQHTGPCHQPDIGRWWVGVLLGS
jgi:hypothetical protein